MSFWAVAQLETRHERLGIYCLGLHHYQVFAPRIATGRRAQPTALLFPGYVFVEIVSGWWEARWSAGVIRLVMSGGTEPAKVPDAVIAELRSRERNGLIVLPSAPQLQRGDRIRITGGPFMHHLGIYAGMKPQQRVEVLLQLLGTWQRVKLPQRDVALAQG
jgi:transcriptional antiterminator RfaH